MSSPKALIFDVGGTVFNWRSTVINSLPPLTEEVLSSDLRENFAKDWRAEMFLRRAEVAEGHAPWKNSDEMLLESLESLSAQYKFIERLDCHQTFVSHIWHNLEVFDGAVATIQRLRENYLVVVLTVLSWESVVKSSKRAGLDWDGILSCEFLGYYKPSRMAYARAVELLGFAPSDVMMVASHETDLAAAKMAGLQTAFILPSEPDEIFTANFAKKTAFDFDLICSDFEALCTQMKNAISA